MTKLRVAFRNFANAHIKLILKYLQFIVTPNRTHGSPLRITLTKEQNGMKFTKTHGTRRRRSDVRHTAYVSLWSTMCLLVCLSVRPQIAKYKISDVFRRVPTVKSRDLPLLNTLSHNSTPAHVFMPCCITEYIANNLFSHYTVRCISIHSPGGVLISIILRNGVLEKPIVA